MIVRAKFSFAVARFVAHFAAIATHLNGAFESRLIQACYTSYQTSIKLSNLNHTALLEIFVKRLNQRQCGSSVTNSIQNCQAIAALQLLQACTLDYKY